MPTMNTASHPLPIPAGNEPNRNDSLVVGSFDLLEGELSETEVAQSHKIRSKYGLEPPTDKLTRPNSYEALFRSMDDTLCNFREGGVTRNWEREVAILGGVIQLLVRRLIDGLVESGEAVENEHPLLEPLCCLIELSLYHGLRKTDPWFLIERLLKHYPTGHVSRSAVENARQFTRLKQGAARLKAWIKMALMNKSLAQDLASLRDREDSLIW